MRISDWSSDCALPIFITAVGPSMLNIVIAVTLAYAPGVSRLARSQVLALRHQDYVKAAEARGEPPLYIMVMEILPNARGPLIIDLCLRAGYTVILIGRSEEHTSELQSLMRNPY